MTRQVSMTCHLAQHSPFSPHFWFDVSGCKLETSLILEILHHFQVLAEGVWRWVIRSGGLKASCLGIARGRR